jgi:hypothetical protein
LSDYKHKVLGVEEDGIWRRNRKRYSHILPQEKYQLNILPSFRDEFWRWFGKQRLPAFGTLATPMTDNNCASSCPSLIIGGKNKLKQSACEELRW